jgi:hypothetical protein
MQKSISKQLFAMTVALTVWQANAAAPPVGIAMSKGSIRVDASAVTGNATLLSGSVVESVDSSSELRMRAGGSVLMAANSRVQVFENRAELQSGKIQVQGSNLLADFGGIRVMAAESGAQAVLEQTGTSVVVGSLRGAVRVLDQDGALLASLHPGKAMAFSPAADEDQGGAGTGNQTPNNNNKKKLRRGAKIWTAAAVAAGVAVPVGVVTTRDKKSTASR